MNYIWFIVTTSSCMHVNMYVKRLNRLKTERSECWRPPIRFVVGGAVGFVSTARTASFSASVAPATVAQHRSFTVLQATTHLPLVTRYQLSTSKPAFIVIPLNVDYLLYNTPIKLPLFTLFFLT